MAENVTEPMKTLLSRAFMAGAPRPETKITSNRLMELTTIGPLMPKTFSRLNSKTILIVAVHEML